MKAKKVIVIMIVAALAVAASIGIRYLVSIGRYESICRDLTVRDIDLSGVHDGSYEGSFDAAGIVSAKVRVEVGNGRIVRIDLLKHRYERGKPGEAVVQEVLDTQSLDVDVVSGATNSSKVILKSIENALAQGL